MISLISAFSKVSLTQMILQYFHPHSFSQETIARLSGIGAAAVELIINCANVARRMELARAGSS